MRIAIIGWYGHCNAGDDRILLCLQRFFQDDEIIATHGFADALRRIDELNRCDYVLIGGGGLIMRSFNVYADLVYRLRAPLGCVGISVEAVGADNRRLIEGIKERARFILVRDRRSQQLLGNIGKVLVGPDLSFLYPFPVARIPTDDSCGVNLRDWYYWRSVHLGRFYNLMKWLDSTSPMVASLYPLPRWRPARVIEILRRDFRRLVPIPLYTEPGAVTDAALLRRFLGQVPDEFSPELLGSCEFAVGMRLHFAIFACQMGVPFVSLAYMPKNLQFCNSIGMERLAVDLFEPATIAARIDEVKASAKHIRQHLLDTTRGHERTIHSLMRQVCAVMGRGMISAPSVQ
jgi:polysaccharide pyruvyl transferase WcaK-like protein